jgi:hypothetical protein
MMAIRQRKALAPARGCVKSLSLVETFTPVCGLYQA